MVDRLTAVIRYVPANDRFHSSFPGVESWHGFAAGGHYDPERVSFANLIGLDEHRVAPSGGFDWHPHRDVHIASWVLEGALRHEDSGGTVHVVEPGTLLVQSTGDGVRHAETNASAQDGLRFVQLTFLAGAPPSVRLHRLPTRVAAVDVAVQRDGVITDGTRPTVVLVLDGRLVHDDVAMTPGDRLDVDSGDAARVEGEGTLLVLSFPSSGAEVARPS